MRDATEAPCHSERLTQWHRTGLSIEGEPISCEGQPRDGRYYHKMPSEVEADDWDSHEGHTGYDIQRSYQFWHKQYISCRFFAHMPLFVSAMSVLTQAVYLSLQSYNSQNMADICALLTTHSLFQS
ncbi:hypothetical protein P879_06911 [Paragonimus westermani]|uniref:Uncharacterized protein n=1 Tax=Paragonimus westermani TaxID=34504 RepID=A0A8T0DEM8_9TREM|nr:hypothetical protein P879_06911 [Paragonimus westermani]